MAQAEQYFAAEPQSKDVRRKLHVTLRGNEADVEVSNGVFSGNRVDLGTSVLLRQAPEPPEEGTFLDLGCGWGPIALTLGFESPKADIWALDVNERALELTRRNAELNGMGNIHAVTAEQGPARRYRAFLRLLLGHARVVVGTRAAAYAPVSHLGLAVVWDDGDDRLDERRAPYAHARQVLALRSALEGTGKV